MKTALQPVQPEVTGVGRVGVQSSNLRGSTGLHGGALGVAYSAASSRHCTGTPMSLLGTWHRGSFFYQAQGVYTMSFPKSIAHVNAMNMHGATQWPDGLVDWREGQAANLDPDNFRGSHSTTSCAYCGSMHPTDLVAALKAGAKLEFADWKYGWPHKVYVQNVPNPYAGLPESVMGCSHATPDCPKTGKPCLDGKQTFTHPICECMRAGEVTHGQADQAAVIRVKEGYSSHTGAPEYGWHDAGQPAPATTWGKFYTEHLLDATPEEKLYIEQHLNMHIDFKGTGQQRRVSWRPFGQAPKVQA